MSECSSPEVTISKYKPIMNSKLNKGGDPSLNKEINSSKFRIVRRNLRMNFNSNFREHPKNKKIRIISRIYTG